MSLMKLTPELAAACKENDYEAAIVHLDAFMAEHPDMTRQEALALIALWALDQHHTDFYRACVEKGGLTVDPSQKETNQKFAFSAVACDDLSMLQLYLEKGELPMDIGSSYTGDLLNWAATKNAITVATWLLDEKRFDVDSDKSGYTYPIAVVAAAAWTDDPDDTRMLKLLLEHGVQFKGKGVINQAAAEGHVASVHVLLEHGADLEEVEIPGSWDESVDLGTPLWFAAANGDVETVEYLLRHRPNLLYKDPRLGLTPVEVAKERGHEDCVKVLDEAMHIKENKD